MFSVGTGAQYTLSDKVCVRVGYIFNTNPIPAPVTLFNIQAPAITQHTISAGLTAKVADNIDASLAYAYGFQNSITGTLVQVPGTNTTLSVSSHSLLLGVTIRFGAPWKHETPVAVPTTEVMPTSVKSDAPDAVKATELEATH